ncbi:MAG: hypothetical protein RI535_00630 [Psychroflexus sp.]|nr:hypothetical protein [Psychroflexus sp.]
MKVIVLCSGRTGSLTLSKSCQHISNYTCNHESKVQLRFNDRFKFPDQHIEIDNRLIWQLGSLQNNIGDDARYVYLKRDLSKVKKSFINRLYQPKSIFYSYCESVKKSTPENKSATEIDQLADDFLKTVDDNIRFYLKDKSYQMEFQLENYATDFSKFWDFIAAKGDYDKAVSEFSKQHNPSKKSKANLSYDLKRMLKRYTH